MSCAKREIHLGAPSIGEEEIEAIAATIRSGWISMGDKTREFEEAFARIHGVDEAVAVNSGTAALHLALSAHGVGPGDEVLVPSLTFVATVNVVRYVNAKPVFVDIESLERPHISLKDAESKVTEKTRAVIVMHYAGYGVDMEAWRKFADEHSLLLVEDAAHAPGLEGAGVSSDATAFSFFTNKNMTTAEGGIVFVADPDVRKRVRMLRSHGMTVNTLERFRGHAFSYDVEGLGFNYRLDDIRASIGLVQLVKLIDGNRKRRDLSAKYREVIGSISGIDVPFQQDHKTVAHIMPVLLPEWLDRRQVMTCLRSDGIQSSIHYPPAHRFTAFRELYEHTELSVTEEYSRRVLTLPLHPGMQPSDVDYIVDRMEEAAKFNARGTRVT